MQKNNLFLLCIAQIAVLLTACSRYQMTPLTREIREKLATVEADKFYLMENTPYETAAYIFSTTESGPAIFILGGTHGDEPAGYEAAIRLVDRFLKYHLLRGKVIVIPEANKQSVEAYRRRIPVPAGEDEERGNLNRCYPGDSAGFPMERLAYQIQTLAKQYQVTVLLDLHEARNYHLEIEETAEKKGLGQTLIYFPNEAGSWLVINLLDQINSEIMDGHKKFSALEQPIPHSASWWAGNTMDIAAFTFETSRKADLEERIGYHLRLVEIVLQTEGMIP